MKGNTGTTLMESLLALVMTVLTLTLGLPMMQDFMANQRMRAWMAGLHTLLNHAREQAVVRQQRVVVCASSQGRTCDGGVAWNMGVLVFADHNLDRKRQADEPVIRFWQTDASGLRVHTSQGRKTLRYLPDGTSPGSNARITLCDARGHARARALVLSNTGRVRQEWADRGVRIQCN